MSSCLILFAVQKQAKSWFTRPQTGARCNIKKGKGLIILIVWNEKDFKAFLSTLLTTHLFQSVTSLLSRRFNLVWAWAAYFRGNYNDSWGGGGGEREVELGHKKRAKLIRNTRMLSGSGWRSAGGHRWREWPEHPRFLTFAMIKVKSKPLIPPSAICGCDAEAPGVAHALLPPSEKWAPMLFAHFLRRRWDELCAKLRHKGDRQRGICALQSLPVQTLLTRPDSWQLLGNWGQLKEK